MKPIWFIVAFASLFIVGCSSPDDEGGGSTATPANKLDRPMPEETAGGQPTAGPNSGTLPGKP